MREATSLYPSNLDLYSSKKIINTNFRGDLHCFFSIFLIPSN